MITVRAILLAVATGLIRLYRAVLAPVLPTSCKHYPSCSRYAEEALKQHGLIVGARLALQRLLRCHPFARGGYDPVPGKGR